MNKEDGPRSLTKVPCAEDGDPLARFLIKWRWTPFLAGLSFVGFIAIVLLVALTVYFVRDHHVRIEPFGGWTGISITSLLLLIGGFSFGYFYLWQVKELNILFYKLTRAGVIEKSERRNADVSSPQEQFLSAFSSHSWKLLWVSILALLVVLGLLLGVNNQCVCLLSPENQKERLRYISIFNWAGLAVGVLWLYVAFMIIIRTIVSAVALDRALRPPAEVRVWPLHPDKCGGLKAINSYAMGLAYLATISGFGLAALAFNSSRAGNLSGDWFLWFLMAIYMLGAPAVFFGPLWATHAHMQRVKEEHLQTISERFQKEYKETQKVIREGSEDLSPRISKLDQLRQLYQATDAFPVWPFDLPSLRRFLLAFAAPLVTTALTIILERLFSP